MQEYRNTQTFLQGYFPKWFEKSFVIQKVKNTVPWTWKGYDNSFNSVIDETDIV